MVTASYTWLDDHGAVRRAGWRRRNTNGFVEELDWYAPDVEAAARIADRRRPLGEAPAQLLETAGSQGPFGHDEVATLVQASGTS